MDDVVATVVIGVEPPEIDARSVYPDTYLPLIPCGGCGKPTRHGFIELRKRMETRSWPVPTAPWQSAIYACITCGTERVYG